MRIFFCVHLLERAQQTRLYYMYVKPPIMHWLYFLSPVAAASVTVAQHAKGIQNLELDLVACVELSLLVQIVLE